MNDVHFFDFLVARRSRNANRTTNPSKIIIPKSAFVFFLTKYVKKVTIS